MEIDGNVRAAEGLEEVAGVPTLPHVSRKLLYLNALV